MFDHVLAVESKLIATEKEIALYANHLAKWFESREIPDGHTGGSFFEIVYVSNMVQKINDLYAQVQDLTFKLRTIS